MGYRYVGVAMKYADKIVDRTLKPTTFLTARKNKQHLSGKNLHEVLQYITTTPKTPTEIARESGIYKPQLQRRLNYLEQIGRINIGPDYKGEATYVSNYHNVRKTGTTQNGTGESCYTTTKSRTRTKKRQ